MILIILFDNQAEKQTNDRKEPSDQISTGQMDVRIKQQTILFRLLVI